MDILIIVIQYMYQRPCD